MTDLPRVERDQLVAIVGRLMDGTSEPVGLDDPRRQQRLVAAAGEIDIEQWPQGADLQQALLHWYARRPVTAPSVAALADSMIGEASGTGGGV